MERSDVTFTSAGVDCAAWLYAPAGDGPHPVVVMAHGFSATRDQRLDAYARTIPWVDGARVALFGSSFSGGHVIALAAADQSIAAVVSQCPFTDSFASLPKLGPANAVRATLAGLRDEVRTRTGRGPAYIPPVGLREASRS